MSVAASAAQLLPNRAWARSAPRYPAIHVLVDQTIATEAAPGVVVAVGKCSGPTRYVSGGTLAFGSSHAVDENSLWRVYSMTKPITGMAAMLLIAEGKLKLDQPIADFLPAYSSIRVLTDPAKSLDARPATGPITIRHLLTHTAGLGTLTSPGPLADAYRRAGLAPSRVSRAEQDGASAPSASSLEMFADRLATLPLLSDPGAKWSYSVGLDLLGRVLEVASGMPFDRLLEQRFFVPLKMRSSFFQVPRDQAVRLATNYRLKNGVLEQVDGGTDSVFLDPPAYPAGGAGLVSSAHDYDRFLAMLANHGTLDGITVMPPSAVKLGMSNLLPPGASMASYYWPASGDGFGAGGSVGLSGPGKGDYGWLGVAGSKAFVNADSGLRASGFINVMDNYTFAPDLVSAVHRDIG
ncbi:serine hydrolase domain-containing protein [Sphingobium sp. Cam5-1]|uniref:serine hydrolase domain-containing protein n=1 Tax=Sphingobium sp. Cam5-1 TaxID=2789327 RepID=UPI0018AD2CDC|nr:serine hydrolase domain-containing protein [Sphingobium sp. Cam5-1]QPI72139.1 beta-lactamase family protein [Sphingobium sp. Cam5-1]